MSRAGFLLLLLAILLFLVTGCGKQDPVPLQVGTHDIAVVFPSDWEHFEYGEQHQWRQDFNRIAIQDYGRMGTMIDLAIDRALVKLRDDERREIASRDTLLVSGRDARMIATWDHVSHEFPKRYLFVLNQNKLLVLYTMQGQFDLMEPTFTKMANSLAFVDTVATGH
ncbi:MAG: hypothetical protein QNL91_14880 [Candidatus Krumholzibacteria bacterium]|nr:hypothetical protein [Candidatus Krumholzibacteria bacterium]